MIVGILVSALECTLTYNFQENSKIYVMLINSFASVDVYWQKLTALYAATIPVETAIGPTYFNILFQFLK